MVSPDDPAVSKLLDRARDGDEVAWNTLLLRYREALVRLARRRLDPRLADRVDAEDVVQQALLDASQELGTFFRDRERVTFPEWLGQRVRTRIRRTHQSHLGTLRRDVTKEFRLPPGLDDVGTAGWPDLLPGSDTSPSGRASRNEAGRLLAEAIGQLPESDRDVVTLFFVEGHSYEEIGEKLGLTVDATRQRLHRAVSRLKKLLHRTYPGWCHAFETETQRRG